MSTPGAPAADGVALPRDATGRRRLLAQARFWLAFSLVLAGVILWTRAGFAIPLDTIAGGPVPLMLAMLSALGYAGVGLLLSLRRPEVRIGAIEAWLGVAVGALALAWSYLALVNSPASVAPGAAPYVALAAAVFVTPFIAALTVWLVLLFPTDRLLSAAWRRVALLALAGTLLAGVGRILRPGPLTFVGNYDNPIGATSLGAVGGLLQTGGYLALGVSAAAAGVSIVQRYLGGDAVERAQLRVFAALSAVGVVTFVFFVALFLLPQSDAGLRDSVVILNLLVITIAPFALALAVARYRLWELDHLVGRTFVYGVLTAILAGVYAASIRLLQTVFVFLTGEGSEASLVITTLILATTFTPIKNRLDKVAAAWMTDPAHAIPADPGSNDPGVAPAVALTPQQLLDDPTFAAALDARIRAALTDESARAAAEVRSRPTDEA